MDKKIQKRKIDTKMNYIDMLNTYGVKELKDIAKKWSLKGYSKMKKEELIDVLYACITEELETELYSFNYDHFSIVTGLSDGVNDTLKYPVAADQLIDMGLIVEGTVDGERQIILPEEVYTIFKAFYSKGKDVIETNTLTKDFLELMINLYGVVKVEFFYEKLKEFSNLTIPENYKAYVLNYSCDATRNVKVSGDYIHHILLDEYEKVYQDVLVKDEISYKGIDDTLVKGFLDHGNYFWTETHDQLNKLLVKHLKFSIVDVYLLLDEMRIMLSYNHGIADFIQHITKKFELDMVVVKELAECLITINNEMPHWELKGFAPMELSKYQKQQPIVKGDKIGRNDPCPCGSGKKYKKCCLKSS